MVNKDQLAAQNLIIEELRLMIVKLQERVKELEDKKVTQETRKFHRHRRSNFMVSTFVQLTKRNTYTRATIQHFERGRQ